MLVTRSAGSDLIVALCKAGWASKALRVYRDMMASAWGTSTGAAKHAHSGSSQQEAEPPVQTHAHGHNEAPAAADPSHQSSQRRAVPSAHSHAERPLCSTSGDDNPLTDSSDNDTEQRAGNIEQDKLPAGEDTCSLCQPPADPMPTLVAPVRRASLRPSTASEAELALNAKHRKPSQHVVKQKGQPILIPHIAAVGALVGALARSGDLDTALELYAQVLFFSIPMQPLETKLCLAWLIPMQWC